GPSRWSAAGASRPIPRARRTAPRVPIGSKVRRRGLRREGTFMNVLPSTRGKKAPCTQSLPCEFWILDLRFSIGEPRGTSYLLSIQNRKSKIANPTSRSFEVIEPEHHRVPERVVIRTRHRVRVQQRPIEEGEKAGPHVTAVGPPQLRPELHRFGRFVGHLE